MRVNLFIIFLAFSISTYGQNYQRNEINIPNLTGFVTLKCDFHMHTYYSDGDVSPETRVREAWMEGLDVIAISDHLESWKFDLTELSDRNRPYKDAIGLSNQLGITIINSIELTKKMPPGHLNILFLEDANILDKVDYLNAIEEAKRQGAFIFWNHPGLVSQAPNGAKWYHQHTLLIESGLLDGIEIASYSDWEPIVFDWIEKYDLTMLGNSDAHVSIDQHLKITNQPHRPMTIVFARDQSPESIKKALKEQRSIVWIRNNIIGEKKYVEKIVQKSVKIKSIQQVSDDVHIVHVQNNSDFNFTITKIRSTETYMKLSAGKTITFYINVKDDIPKNIKITFENVKISSNKTLETEIKF